MMFLAFALFISGLPLQSASLPEIPARSLVAQNSYQYREFTPAHGAAETSHAPSQLPAPEIAHVNEPRQPTLNIPVTIAALAQPTPILASGVPSVPFYSQFLDITSPKWQKVGCGVTSLAMIIDYYASDSVSVNALLTKGVAAGAYLNNAGWTYKGLIALSNDYGLVGESIDLGTSELTSAYARFTEEVQDGPVIASVHYEFDPKSTIPHLVVITGIEGDTLYYNDPAEKSGNKTISAQKFQKAWKKRFIVIRPAA